VKRYIIQSIIPAVAIAALTGCRDNSPPPPRSSVPPIGTYTEMRPVSQKPLPPSEGITHAPPYDDVPLITQAPPEQPAFVEAYRGVGSPRVALFVNRTLEGRIVETVAHGPIAGVEVTRETTAGVKMESTRERLDPWGRPLNQTTDRFETQGPGRVTDRTEVYLAPGEYDAVAAARIDYDAVENIMTDWLAAGGKVTIVSPKLTQAQTASLQQGERNMLQDLSKNGSIDVLIQVQAKPTKQTPAGLELRLIAEAINTRGGESLARAVVDVPPPLDKPAVNEYTRFLARKVMSDLSRTWTAPQPAPREEPREPRPPEPTPPARDEIPSPTTAPVQGTEPAVPQ
jgi:hypothetical protein